MATSTYVAYTSAATDTFNTPTFGTTLHKYVVVMLAYFAVSGPTLPANVTVDGNNMTLGVSIGSTATEVDCIIGIYYYKVPVSWNSTAKEVDVSGGAHADHHIACAVEITTCGGAGTNASDAANEDLTISGCKAASIILNMVTYDGAGSPTFVSGGTAIEVGNHNDGDDRLDRGWGWAYGAVTAGANTMNWTATDRCIASLEMIGFVSGSQGHIIG